MKKIKRTAQQLADELDLYVAEHPEGSPIGFENKPTHDVFSWINTGGQVWDLNAYFDVDFGCLPWQHSIAEPTPEYKTDELIMVWNPSFEFAAVRLFIRFDENEQVVTRPGSGEVWASHARFVSKEIAETPINKWPEGIK